MVFARRPQTPLPQKPITDDTLRHARALMAAFAGAVGSDPAIRRVSADIQAGVSSHNDLLKPGAIHC